jgi:membrane protein CcdC involved in cytochrome C biogenesis
MAELDLSFLLPLILLVVAGLANVAREVKILELSYEVHDDVNLLHGGPIERLLRPLLRTSLHPGERFADWLSWDDTDAAEEADTPQTAPDEDAAPSPSLGRFNHIHAFNSFLMAVALVLTALVQNGLNGVLLALIISVFWINLPTFEINEYDLMLKHFGPNDPLNSLSFHSFATGAASLPILVLSYVDISSTHILAKAVGATVFILIGVFIGNFYQSMLDDELQTLAERGVTQDD